MRKSVLVLVLIFGGVVGTAPAKAKKEAPLSKMFCHAQYVYVETYEGDTLNRNDRRKTTTRRSRCKNGFNGGAATCWFTSSSRRIWCGWCGRREGAAAGCPGSRPVYPPSEAAREAIRTCLTREPVGRKWEAEDSIREDRNRDRAGRIPGESATDQMGWG
jgi:hypothetical protein